LEDRCLWYSGAGTVSLIDTNTDTIKQVYSEVSDNLDEEPFGFFDYLNHDMLFLMTYGREKKSFYLYNTQLKKRMLTRTVYQDYFFSISIF